MVAGAKRGGKRMLAVVFGSYSAAQRAEDAATLLERGFRRETPDNQFGMLESVRNIGGDPYDMRNEMCNPKRKRPAAESVLDEDEDDGDTDDSVADEKVGSKGKQAKRTKQPRVSLLGDLTPSMPPIRVFTGPPQKVPEDGIVATPAKADAPEKPAKTEKPKPVQAGVAPAAIPAAAKAKEPQKSTAPKK
jgi:D-alanyl-D-alanine carboxypeptidase